MTETTSNIFGTDTVLGLLVDFFSDTEEDRAFIDGDATEKAIHLMRCFSGTVLRIPTMVEVERVSRREAIVAKLTENPERATVRHMAEIHGMPTRAVAKTYSRATGRGLAAQRKKTQSQPAAVDALATAPGQAQ